MLTICRASAGSGKTYKLTLEYLKLILSSEQAYQHILAVTFTNKATDEMKHRIVEKLDVLTHHTEQSEYLEVLRTTLGLTVAELQLRSQQALYRLLHDFAAFNVSTIDRFFQQTTRAFTREIGLQGGYNLELDNSHVLTQAIDRMLFDLEAASSKELLGWLLRFSQSKVESGQYWDVRKDITTLANEIFKESYKYHSDKIVALTRDKSLLRKVQQQLYAKQRIFEQALVECGTDALAIMERYSLTAADFKGGSRSPFTHFTHWAQGRVKEPTATFVKLSDGVEGWYIAKTPADKRAAICTAYDQGLSECVARAITIFDALPNYLTTLESGRYLYTLGILSDITHYIQEYAQEHNLLLLSDTSELLNRIIDGSDTPFIYEKIGTYLEHFMVDEFQDTSKLQWENFYPLFRESLDNGHDNFVVGDVKQSIYRWRDSDWMLLNERLSTSFSSSEVTHDQLHTNWRSARHVVLFNNTLFMQATALLQQQFAHELEASTLPHDHAIGGGIAGAYHDIYQELPPKESLPQGHVRTTFIDTQQCDDWREEALAQLPPLLVELQQRGTPLRDIAFLVRTNSEAALIAHTLLQCKAANLYPGYRFDLISDEALYIGSFPIIKLVVSVLKYLQNPTAEINNILAAYEYATTRCGATPSEALSGYFTKSKQGEALFTPQFQTQLEALKLLPLFEMCEQIFALFPSTDDNDGVFVQAFQDMVLDYTTRRATDLNAFLQWWDERGCHKTISTPASQDAIRIYTIHKSKGLEFKVTIMPFCDWEIDNIRHSSILWTPPAPELEIELPIIPLKYSTSLARTSYAAHYFEEKMYNYIDNINLAYVAFTRAKESLILFAPQPLKEEAAVGSIATLLYATLAEGRGASTTTDNRPLLDLSAHYDSEQLTYEIGELPQTERAEHRVETPTAALKYHSIDPSNRLHLRLYGKGFFNDSKDRTYGNLMHEMLSKVYLPKDIEPVVFAAYREGKLTYNEATQIATRLNNWIASDHVSRWFSPQMQILNETEILQPTGVFYRPDRVVITPDGVVEIIDYKFGHKQRTSYLKQVKQYIHLLRTMNYPQVTGYLWYVELDEVVVVNA